MVQRSATILVLTVKGYVLPCNPTPRTLPDSCPLATLFFAPCAHNICVTPPAIHLASPSFQVPWPATIKYDDNSWNKVDTPHDFLIDGRYVLGNCNCPFHVHAIYFACTFIHTHYTHTNMYIYKYVYLQIYVHTIYIHTHIVGLGRGGTNNAGSQSLIHSMLTCAILLTSTYFC